MVSKIHWSAMSDTLRFACETDSRKCGHNAKHRSDLTACQYLAKHEQRPDLYCKRCARVAADMVPTDREEPGSVTFTAAEVEHLRGLVKYLARGWVGGNGAEGLRVLREKVGRDRSGNHRSRAPSVCQ